MTESIAMTWGLEGIPMRGALVRPEGEGPFPAVVLVAGSGPTDGDWCSRLLPGTNGSGRLLAEAFAEAGIASLRYDKVASDPNFDGFRDRMLGKLSMKWHLEELVTAVDALASQDFVDATRIVGLGNSEGTLHVLHYATSTQRVPFAGIVLAAPPGRSVGQVMLAQLGAQAARVPNGEELMTAVREAAARYTAGQPMDPDPRLPEDVRSLLRGFESPIGLPLARELWAENAADSLPAVTLPTLVLIGGKDIQVDIHADGEPLQKAAAGMPNVTFAFPPTANHVLKEENRTVDEVLANMRERPGYNEGDTRLDPDALDTILTWLRDVLAPVRDGGTA